MKRATTDPARDYSYTESIAACERRLDAGEVVAWCRAVGEALNGQQLAAHDAVKHAHHQIKLTAAPATGSGWSMRS